MPGGGEPIDISGQFPEPTPGDDSADTGTAANPVLVADGDGATSVAADGGAEGYDPYADDGVELPRHVVVKINGVTLQRLASSLFSFFGIGSALLALGHKFQCFFMALETLLVLKR